MNWSLWIERSLYYAVIAVLCWRWWRIHNKALRYRITDPLTGLLNRRGFEDQLKSEFNRAKRKNFRIGVVYLDCDGFKSINDTKGHAVGDVVLQKIATIIRENIRSYDQAGRIGGDEFVILMPEVDEAKMEQVIERIQKSLLPTFADFSETISLSIGLAVSSDVIATPQELIRAADRDMYRKKREIE